MRRKVGIREVATTAGVSIATVSNVLNKPELVSPGTRQKVLAVMDEVGFVRNDLARQLRMGGGTTLGMTVLNVANPFFADLAHACESAAEAVGHTIVFGSSDQSPSRQDRYLDLFEEQRVRGMLIAPIDGVTDRMRRLRTRGMPMVLFDIHDERDFCSVALDGRAGGELATRHLIESGRSHIAFLGGPLHQVDDRWRGAQSACAATRGVQLTHLDTPNQSIADGRAAGALIEAMSPEERPDGIFAANDLLAIGLLLYIVASNKIRVPQDLGIIGYDDIDYMASASVPLSSIRQPTDLLAENAVRLVLGEVPDANHSHEHEHVRLLPELVVRQSTRRVH